MTPEERKRGLRQAHEARFGKQPKLQTTAHLWEIIDSLVDQQAEQEGSKLLDALLVLIRTPHILAYLRAMDPQALRQALGALPPSATRPQDALLYNQLGGEAPQTNHKTRARLLAVAHAVLSRLDELFEFHRVCTCGHRQYTHVPACQNGWVDPRTGQARPCTCQHFHMAGYHHSVNILYSGGGDYCIDRVGAEQQAEREEEHI